MDDSLILEKTNTKKLYFFRKNSNRFLICYGLLRMIGCLLIGQNIYGFSHWKEEDQINIYFYRK